MQSTPITEKLGGGSSNVSQFHPDQLRRVVKSRLVELLLHLRSFHGDFYYELYHDRKKLHIFVRRKECYNGINSDKSNPKDEGKSIPCFCLVQENLFFCSFGKSASSRDYIYSHCIGNIPFLVIDDSKKSNEWRLSSEDKLLLESKTCINNKNGEYVNLASSSDSGSVVDECLNSSSCSSQSSRVYYYADGRVSKDIGRFYNIDQVVDSHWKVDHINRCIEDHEDIHLKEKNFMCKWNEHIVAFPVYADIYMSFACEVFARRHAHFILEHNMRHIFLMHMISLWDHSLVALESIETCMTIVDGVLDNMKK